MSLVCKYCRAENSDSSIFCSMCGEPLDKDLRFIMKMEKMGKTEEETSKKPLRVSTYDDDYSIYRSGERRTYEEEGGSIAPLIILIFLAAAGAVFIFGRFVFRIF